MSAFYEYLDNKKQQLNNIIIESTKYLIEELILESTSKLSADAMGKLHELRFAHHLSTLFGKDNGHILDNREAGKKAHDIHQQLIEKAGGIHSKTYQDIDNAAKMLAHHWVEHHFNHYANEPATNNGEALHIHHIHWSSQKNDHTHITGVENPLSKADIIVHAKTSTGKSKFFPISLKYTKTDPNMSNNGLSTIAKEAGLNHNTLHSIWNEHMKRSENYHSGDSAISRSHAFKIDEIAEKAGTDNAFATIQHLHNTYQNKKTLSAKDKGRFAATSNWLKGYHAANDKRHYINKSISNFYSADTSKGIALETMAKETAKSFNTKSGSAIHDSLIALSAPHHEFHEADSHKFGSPSVAISYTKTKEPKLIVGHEHDFVTNHLSQFNLNTFKAEHSGNGVIFYAQKHSDIDAANKENKKLAALGKPFKPKEAKFTKVGLLNFKGTNGPYNGANTTLVLHNIISDTLKRKSK